MKSGFIDAHAHLSDSPGSVDRLVSSMDSLGIERTVVVAGGLMSPERLSEQIALGGGSDVNAANGFVLEASQHSRGRLLPFYFANPHVDSQHYRSVGREFVGMKLGPAVHGVPLCDIRNRRLVAIASELGHPVYLHCLARPGFGVSDLVSLACFFPQTTFILGHAGIGNCDLYAVSQVRSHENILFETSGGFSAVIAHAIAELGPDRVMFGSEYPLQSVSAELEKLRALDLPAWTMELVTRLNVLQLCEGGGQ